MVSSAFLLVLEISHFLVGYLRVFAKFTQFLPTTSEIPQILLIMSSDVSYVLDQALAEPGAPKVKRVVSIHENHNTPV